MRRSILATACMGYVLKLSGKGNGTGGCRVPCHLPRWSSVFDILLPALGWGLPGY